MATPEQIEIIRANLIGLPDEITDIVVGVIIDSSKTLHDAAIALAESTASLFAGDTTIKVGSLAINGEQESERWLQIKQNLITRKLTNSGIIVDPGDGSGTVIPTLGATVTGSEVTDMETTANDSNRVPNQEEVGMFNNRPNNPTGAYDTRVYGEEW